MLVPRLRGTGCWERGSGLTRGSSGQPRRWRANARTDIPARGSGPPFKKSDHAGLQKSCADRRKSWGNGGWKMDGQTDRCTHSARFHQFSRGRMLPTPSGTLIYFLFCPRPLSPLVNHRTHSSGHVLGSEQSLPSGAVPGPSAPDLIEWKPAAGGPCLG